MPNCTATKPHGVKPAHSPYFREMDAKLECVMRFPDNHRNLHCAPANAVLHTCSPIASFTFPAHTECFYPNMKTLCRFSVPLLYNMAIPVCASENVLYAEPRVELRSTSLTTICMILICDSEELKQVWLFSRLARELGIAQASLALRSLNREVQLSLSPHTSG